MSEYERRFDLFGDSLEVLIVPSRSDRGKDAGRSAELWIGRGIVPSDTETIAIDGASGIESETRIKGLIDD